MVECIMGGARYAVELLDESPVSGGFRRSSTASRVCAGLRGTGRELVEDSGMCRHTVGS